MNTLLEKQLVKRTDAQSPEDGNPLDLETVQYVDRARKVLKDCGPRVSMVQLKMALHLFVADYRAKHMDHEFLITWDEYRQLEGMVKEHFGLDHPKEAVRKIEELAGCPIGALVPSKSRKVMSELSNV